MCISVSADTSPLALKPSHWQPTTPHEQPPLRQINNLIADAWTVNTVWVTALPAHRQPYLQHENLQHGVGIPIAGTRATSSPMLVPLSSSPTSPTPTLPASLAGKGFTMTEALPSIGWRPAPPLPLKAAHLDLSASLTLPTLPVTPPKSATPNQGLPTSTSSELPQRSPPTSAPSMQ